jgi:hypothetical protein
MRTTTTDRTTTDQPLSLFLFLRDKMATANFKAVLLQHPLDSLTTKQKNKRKRLGCLISHQRSKKELDLSLSGRSLL